MYGSLEVREIIKDIFLKYRVGENWMFFYYLFLFMFFFDFFIGLVYLLIKFCLKRRVLFICGLIWRLLGKIFILILISLRERRK